MADSNKTSTGGRDDLNVDASRCLKMRFCDSSCQHCIDICPHNAVSVDGYLVVDPEKCRGCLLCTTVCPSGALEQGSNFQECLTKLARVPAPILGCLMTAESAHGTISCLGGLSEEHLLALYHSLAGTLTINLSQCKECPNSRIVEYLIERSDALVAARLSYGSCRLVLTETADTIHFQDELVDRRSFFKSFGKVFIKSAETVLSAKSNKAELQPAYAEKRIPGRKKLLNQTRGKLPEVLQGHLEKHFDSYVSFNESCFTCQGCVAICPTGALQTSSVEQAPIFERLGCTGCGLCAEFCLEQSLLIT